MKGLYKRNGSDCWYYRYQHAGRRQTISTKTTDKKAAEAWVQENVLHIREATSTEEVALRVASVVTQARRVALDHAFDEWASQPRSERLSDSRLALLRSRWDRTQAFLAARGVRHTDQITKSHAEAWWHDRDQAQSSAHTNRSYLQTAKRVLRACGCAAFSELPSWTDGNLEESSRDAFTPDQLNVLASKRDHECWGLFAVALNTGLSLIDVCLLEWSSIELDSGWIRTRRRKTNARLAIPILPGLRTYLTTLDGDGQYVFPEWADRYTRSRSSTTRTIQAFLRDECGFTTARHVPGRAKAVVSLGFHSCRHTFAYLAESAGVPLSVVQSIVGHGSAQMTQRYIAHATDEAKLASLASIPNVLGLPQASPAHAEPQGPLASASDEQLLAECQRRGLLDVRNVA
jgi:integrase